MDPSSYYSKLSSITVISWYHLLNYIVHITVIISYITVISRYHLLSVVSICHLIFFGTSRTSSTDPLWYHLQAVPEVDEDCLNDEGPWHSTKPVWRWRGEGIGWRMVKVHQSCHAWMLWFSWNTYQKCTPLIQFSSNALYNKLYVLKPTGLSRAQYIWKWRKIQLKRSIHDI